MPLTIRDIQSNGHFIVADESDNYVGGGRAKPSHIPGMVTLFFSAHVRELLNQGYGLRVPIDWTKE